MLIAEPAPPAPGSPQAWPAPRQAWFSVGVLTLAYVLSFVDRQILTLLIAPIQTDLRLDDVEVSLLVGAAFAMCYTLSGLWLGWLVDRRDRRAIAAAGVAAWSVMTGACGLAGSYWQLFVARMGVGLGEATLSPAAFSIMADSLPPDKLVRGIGVYSSGAIVGIGMAYLLGGQLAAWAAAGPTVTLPLVGEVRGWQAPFLLLLPPGLAIAALVAVIREPPRRRPAGVDAPRAMLGGFLRRHGPAVGLLFLGMGLQSIVVQSVLAWGPTILTRRFGWDPGAVGLALGPALLVAGLAANLGGAWAGGRRVRAGRPDDLVRLCVLSSGALTLAAPLGSLAASPGATVAALALGFGLGAFATAPALSTLQLATPGELRGRMVALFLLASQLIGMTVGPTMVAIFTEYVFADRGRVGDAQAATATLGAVLSGLAFLAAVGPIRRALAETRAGV